MDINQVMERIPQAARRWCESNVCACVGCVNKQFRALGVTKEEYERWSEANKDMTADALYRSEEQMRVDMLKKIVSEIKTQGGTFNEALYAYKLETGLGLIESREQVKILWNS